MQSLHISGHNSEEVVISFRRAGSASYITLLQRSPSTLSLRGNREIFGRDLLSYEEGANNLCSLTQISHKEYRTEIARESDAYQKTVVYTLRPQGLVKNPVHYARPEATTYPRVKEMRGDSEYVNSPVLQNSICHYMLIRSLLKPLGTVIIPESV